MENNIPIVSFIPEGNTEPTSSFLVEIPKDIIILRQDHVVSPVEFYKIQLERALANYAEINETKLYILAFIKVYGSGYKKEVLKSRICTTSSSLNNFESVLRRMKLLVGYGEETAINDGIILKDENQIVLSFLVKDSSKDEINHRNYKN